MTQTPFDNIPESREEAIKKLRYQWEVEIMSKIRFVWPKWLRLTSIALEIYVIVIAVLSAWGILWYVRKFIGGADKIDAKDILKFYGSYFGGAITLLGVVFAIRLEMKKQEEARVQREEDKRLAEEERKIREWNESIDRDVAHIRSFINPVEELEDQLIQDFASSPHEAFLNVNSCEVKLSAVKSCAYSEPLRDRIHEFEIHLWPFRRYLARLPDDALISPDEVEKVRHAAGNYLKDLKYFPKYKK